MTNPTNPSAQQQYKSSQSGRFVVPGWMNLIEGTPDAIEIQLDLDQSDLSRNHACILIEYWATGSDITLQSVLPVRAFGANKDGWCMMIPAQGRVMLRAIDTEPSPPLLASQWINIDAKTQPGTTVHVKIDFPDPTKAAAQNLNLNN
ncbi:uracil-DNA glycosylase [Deinococcus radiophilus]|uniref:Uracil-DNA glycosylase n=1 Tax=Deinococcus radiophilus TaxID=32062 RepID=A0A431W1P4_9DEIO|nr:uracil-DNA glycosylase [Deinococcus radiophilus]RTR29384.1 uracil-DNA glycosylase [Deinococcus radiophilus]UFA50789.1 uracil-DNA glycosylase [Deinococcus radiophilus]